MVAALALALSSVAARADTAVPREGPVFKGSVKIDATAKEVVLGDERRPLKDVLLVERSDGKLVWAADLESRLLAYRYIVYEDRRPQLVALATDALRAKDHVSARRLYAWAKRERLSGRKERVLLKKVERAEKRPGKVREDKAKDVRRREQDLKKMLPDFLLARTRVELEHGEQGLYLLRDLLSAYPKLGPALALLKERAPADSPFASPRGWLDYAIELEPRGFRLAAEDERELKRARHYWRPDLYGIQSADYIFLTAMQDTGPLVSMALNAHAAVATLKDAFKTDKPFERHTTPLPVRIYIDEENFHEDVGWKRPSPVPPYYQWREGQWNMQDGVTRFLRPRAGRSQGQFTYTVIHEITRQWMWARNPRYSAAQVRSKHRTVGYWAIVGLPAFLALSPLDRKRDRLDLTAGGTYALKLVARRAGMDRGLLNWKTFFLMDLEGIHLLNSQDPLLHKARRKKDELALGLVFSQQAAAVCHYLYNAEDGKYRERFLDAVVHAYTGRQEKLNPRIAFGKSPLELGQAVIRHARKHSK